MQDWFNICNAIIGIHYTEQRERNMMISTDVMKVFDKIQDCLMINKVKEILRELGIELNFLNFRVSIENPRTISRLNDKMSKAFPLRDKTTLQ